MSLDLDVRYAKQLPLDQFKEIQKNRFIFRCPICGDSQKSKTKKRAGLIPTQDNQGLFFNCFNCNNAMSMSYFIYRVNSSLLKNYNKDKFSEQGGVKHIEQKIEKELSISSEKIKNIDLVSEKNEALEYLKKRNIQQKYWSDIYYTENYKKWIVENYLPEKYKHTDQKDERLVFPLYTQRGELVGLQGRSLDPQNDIRYLTVKIKETNYSLCYGLDKINITKKIILTEGIFDALVLDNAIAMLKSNIELDFIRERFLASNIIFVFDNEPRNPNIVKNYDKIAALEEFGLFIWPKNIKVKDMNDLSVLYKASIEDLTKFVFQNTLFGKLKKNLGLSKWKIL